MEFDHICPVMTRIQVNWFDGGIFFEIFAVYDGC